MSATVTSSAVAHEVSIYNNYRAALRAQTDPRAAARRQAARQVTVERYNVSFADVKRIIAKQDALNGITHEHSQDYLNELELKTAQAHFDKHPHECYCGSEDLVRVRVNPQEWKRNRFALVTSCFMCYMEMKSRCE